MKNIIIHYFNCLYNNNLFTVCRQTGIYILYNNNGSILHCDWIYLFISSRSTCYNLDKYICKEPQIKFQQKTIFIMLT